jgi:hypothetical protein
MAPFHGSVASIIGQQVEQMILQAKKDSEARVKHDLSMAKTQLHNMSGVIEELGGRVARCTRNSANPEHSQAVDQAFLTQKIAQLEQKWATEVKAMKQDLHRTIQAHNHNSDLMRHHRDAIEDARRKLDAQSQTKVEQVDQQIERMDLMLRQDLAKERALESLSERITHLEQQIGELAPAAPMYVKEDPARRNSAKKDAEPPTEDEAMNVSQASTGPTAGGTAEGSASGFNVEAPVFVPRGVSAGSKTGTEQTSAISSGGSGSVPAKEPSSVADIPAPVDGPPGILVADDDEVEAVTNGVGALDLEDSAAPEPEDVEDNLEFGDEATAVSSGSAEVPADRA